MANGEVTMLAVGDVVVNREDPHSMFAAVAPVIQSADIAFCQLEATYSERGTVLPHVRAVIQGSPRNAPAIRQAGFNVVSFASNKHLDCGYEAFLDTLEVMKATGIELLGVGRNIREARQPRIITRGDTKIAFLAYSSVLPAGYGAEANRPGCAPLRAWTFYEPVERDQPGTPARVHTFAHEDDKTAMIEDIRKAKARADLVMVSIHWGIHFREAEIAAYQKEIGHAAVDAGAETILGHHAHILKPIEIYKGQPIFYSLGNFGFDQPLPPEVLESPRWKELMELNPSWTIDPRYRSYPFPADSRMTLAAKITLADRRIRKVSFLPALIDENSQPRFLNHREKEFSDLIRYMEKITESQGLDTKFNAAGDEVVVEGGDPVKGQED